MISPLYLIIAVVIVVLAGIHLVLPKGFRITRSILVNAPPSAIFEHVNDLHAWNAWSPWAKMDPNAVNTYGGPISGVGACMSWKGNNKVGEGTMTIILSRPYDLIQLRLDFLKPFKATNVADFTFKTEGSQTHVSWSMYGKNTFMGKIMGLVFNCDKMVGGQFEKGLADLKAIVERGPA